MAIFKMLARIFCKSYGRGFDIVAGTVVIGLLGLICFTAFMPNPLKCSRENRREDLQNSALFMRFQADYYRKNGKFAKDFDRLAAGDIFGTVTSKQQAATKYYYYRMYNLDRDAVVLTSQARVAGLKSVITYDVIRDRMAVTSGKKQLEINMVICQSDLANPPIPSDFRFVGTKTICPTGYTSKTSSIYGRN
jgi:hypothetical protein